MPRKRHGEIIYNKMTKEELWMEKDSEVIQSSIDDLDTIVAYVNYIRDVVKRKIYLYPEVLDFCHSDEVIKYILGLDAGVEPPPEY